jgi:Cu-Zn family superoxide dismutase
MRTIALTAAVLALGVAGCKSSEPAADTADTATAQTPTPAMPTNEATAKLKDAEGKAVGTATATEEAGDVAISVKVNGLTPGEHGVHVHMTGSCQGPDFKSAGGHWNPTNQGHGLDNPPGQHAGDMPNLTVAADGTGMLEYKLVGGTFAELMDADGSAFVVHAMKDDQTSDPSGNSGDRIACGVFAAG